jgi:murein DD-endopeptidase MepM/ murein hydrolase activator NlpD
MLMSLNRRNGRVVGGHPNYVVKRLSIILSLVIGFLLVGSATGLTPALGTIAGAIANKVVLYVNVARLYTKSPDETLAMPVQDVTRRQVANTWHAPRGNDRRHEGQDIFAPRGTPILSATDGYIIRIGENSLGGQTVSVMGAGGRVYYYAHLDSYAPRIEEGDYVTTKTVLGFVGTTGNAAGTPPHLHFGVYAPGGAINPLPLLTDRRNKLATDKTDNTDQK